MSTGPDDAVFALPPGDPAALFAACDELEGLAGKVGTLAADTSRTTADVRGRAGWSGGTAEAYTAFTAGVATGLSGAEAPLNRIAASVRRYGQVLATARREIAAAERTARAAQAAQAASSGADPHSAAELTAARHEAARQHTAVKQAAGQTAEEVGEEQGELARLWEKSEPVRAWIDRLKAPWDVVGADKGLSALIRAGRAPTEWSEELPGLIDEWFHTEVAGLAHEADNGLVPWSEVDAAAARFGSKVDAATAFSQQWMDDTAMLRGATPFLRGLSYTLSGAGLIGDAGVIIHPEDSGAMGWVDRGVAGVNGGLIAANLMVDEIPVAGEVMMIGTGIYLGGDYLYHHWQPFHNAVDAVGHGTVTVAKDIGHGVSSAASTVGHGVSSAASTVGHGVSSAASTLGHVFGL